MTSKSVFPWREACILEKYRIRIEQIDPFHLSCSYLNAVDQKVAFPPELVIREAGRDGIEALKHDNTYIMRVDKDYNFYVSDQLVCRQRAPCMVNLIPTRAMFWCDREDLATELLPETKEEDQMALFR